MTLPACRKLARKQTDAGATYLDVHLGTRGATDLPFVEQVIRGLQASVGVPLCFDFAELKSLECCLRAYDPARAGGALPLINSITEPRWELMEPAQGRAVQDRGDGFRTPRGWRRQEQQVAAPRSPPPRSAASRASSRQHGLAMDDIFVDISVRALIADTEGMTRSTLEAIRLIREDADLRGVHIMGALTNIGQQLPPKAADGSDLKLAIENAFLTLAVPNGLDTIMGTPWRAFTPLPDDNYIMTTFRHFLDQSGSNALRAVRKFYRA